MEKEKILILNRWKTPDGTILTSRYRHEYVEHTDKNGEYYFVDGGSDYIRMSVNNEKMTDMCVYSNNSFDEIRRVMVRGTFDENNKRIWIPLCNMSNPHLENCITYYSDLFDENGCKNKYMIYYLVELLYRWYSNKYIGEKKYTIKDETCEQKDLVEFNRSINDSVKCGIVDSVERFINNINADIHSDKEETIMLVKHIVNLWSEKDSTIKEMLKNWNII